MPCIASVVSHMYLIDVYLTWQAVQVAAFLMSFQMSSAKLLSAMALSMYSISRAERLLSSRDTAARAAEPRTSSESVKPGRMFDTRCLS